MSKQTQVKINFWAMIRDVLVASMTKGQFPLALFGMLLLVLIIKMPATDASKLIFELLHLFADLSIVGWVLSFVFLLGWIYTVKVLRRVHSDEMTRIADEKSKAQGKMLTNKTTTKGR